VLTQIDCFVLSDNSHEEDDDVNRKPIPCKHRQRIVTNSDEKDASANCNFIGHISLVNCSWWQEQFPV